ncbi:hypothetical protein BGX23_007148 [Mortierella sp. AD031]|nr:hypothetical protein BGX23_007148 [Mortierella sp. AD031]
MSEFDYAVVEDTGRKDCKNPIVSCVCLLRVRAYYGSVKLFFGEPELIATDPEYRNRGLVRRLLFEMIHPESEARGDALQFIPGIPYYYRASTIKNIQSLPSLAKDKTEPFILRKATTKDIPYLISMSTKERVSPHASVGLFYGPEYWKYAVADYPEIKENEYDMQRDTQIIVDAATGKYVGFTVFSSAFGPKLEALVLDNEEVSWHEAAFPVLRQIVANEKARLEEKKAKTVDPEAAKAVDIFSFPLVLHIHPGHPAAAVLDTLLTPPPNEPGYRFYVRINNYPQFIRTVTPELERRLADSPMAGLSGKLQLDFFRMVERNKAKGLEIEFKKGKLVEAKDWAKPSPEEKVAEYLAIKAREDTSTIYEASFAPLTFNNLLIGERSLQDLIWSHGETTYKDDGTKLLINTLFPKGDQHIDTFFW